MARSSSVIVDPCDQDVRLVHRMSASLPIVSKLLGPQRNGAEGLMPPHQQHLYSITSSARASSVDGTSRPSAFAVLRLITNSYLVGACTGRSAGFSPLRMRLTVEIIEAVLFLTSTACFAYGPEAVSAPILRSTSAAIAGTAGKISEST